MDFQKGRILLDKINTLYKSMEITPDDVSTIERDLLKNYLQQLYGITLEEKAVPVAPPPPEPKREEPIEVIRATPKPAPPPRPKPTYEKPRVIEVPESLKEEVKEAPPQKEEPVVSPPPPPRPQRGSGEMEELFEQYQAKELSDKLSELPIVDLNKSMGLNERIFTINELFEGDQQAFQETMNQLNGLSNFEEAKNYLIANVANKYEWADESKQKKARNFIKLVRRRFKS
jgi:hypothetical protein